MNWFGSDHHSLSQLRSTDKQSSWRNSWSAVLQQSTTSLNGCGEGGGRTSLGVQWPLHCWTCVSRNSQKKPVLGKIKWDTQVTTQRYQRYSPSLRLINFIFINYLILYFCIKLIFFFFNYILQGHIFFFTFQLLICYSFDELYLKAIAPTPKKCRHILEDSMY